MNKWSRIAVTSAVALALASPAYAQSVTPSPAPDTTPQSTPSTGTGASGTSSDTGAAGAGSSMGGAQTQSTAPSTPTASTPTAAAVDIVTEQQDGQSLSSDLIGMKVVGSNQESIGKVSDLIIEDGRLVGAILDVGGFLGLGAKQVGVPWDSLTVTNADGSTMAGVTLTKEELADMPEFKTLADVKAEQSRQTTGATTGGATTGGIPKN